MHKTDPKAVWSFLLFYMALGGWTSSMRGPDSWICGHEERSVPENTCVQVADFALQTVLKVTVDFLPNARAGHLINSSIFFVFAKLSSIKNISLTNITLKFFKKPIFEELEVTFYFTHIPSPSSISSWAKQRYLKDISKAKCFFSILNYHHEFKIPAASNYEPPVSRVILS